jgi:hypothetical protein
MASAIAASRGAPEQALMRRRETDRRIEPPAMVVSASLMFRRFIRALKHAMREEDFAPVLAAAAFLIALGTITYTFGNGWNIAEGFCFSVATLTTASIASPDLAIDEPWMGSMSPGWNCSRPSTS